MMLKTGANVAVWTLLLGVTGAMAQTAVPQQRTMPASPSATTAGPKLPVAGQILVQDGDTVLAKELIGEAVYGPDKAKIGKISDLILSTDGKTVAGFVIGVGGFLGIGEKSVAPKMGRLQMARDQDGMQLLLDVKQEELANAPSFKSKRDVDAERQAAERAREHPQVPRVPQPGGPTQQRTH